MKSNGLVAYQDDLVQLDVTESKRRYLIDQGYTMLGSLPAGVAELRVEDADLEAEDRFSLRGLTLSDVVSLENLIMQTYWRGAQTVRMRMLGEAESSFLELPKQSAQSGLEVFLESGETQKCSPKIVSYCHEFLKQGICLQSGTALRDTALASGATVRTRIW